jgi:hypothetical protein
MMNHGPYSYALPQRGKRASNKRERKSRKRTKRRETTGSARACEFSHQAVIDFTAWRASFVIDQRVRVKEGVAAVKRLCESSRRLGNELHPISDEVPHNSVIVTFNCSSHDVIWRMLNRNSVSVRREASGRVTMCKREICKKSIFFDFLD